MKTEKTFFCICMACCNLMAATVDYAVAPPGSYNIAFGYGAGYNTSGDNLNVIAIGSDSGMNSSYNTNSVFIGATAGQGLSGHDGAVVIGDAFVHTNGHTEIKGLFDGVSFGIVDGKIAVYTNGVFVMYLSGGGAQTVSVSFDTDYGDALSSTSVVKGVGFTPPTDINKFATTLGGIADGAFTLEGWYTDAAKTVRYNGEAINSDCTLYAKWTDNREVSSVPYFTGASPDDDWFGVSAIDNSFHCRMGLSSANCECRFISSDDSIISSPFTNSVEETVEPGGSTYGTFNTAIGYFSRIGITKSNASKIILNILSPGDQNYCTTNNVHWQ